MHIRQSSLPALQRYTVTICQALRENGTMHDARLYTACGFKYKPAEDSLWMRALDLCISDGFVTAQTLEKISKSRNYYTLVDRTDGRLSPFFYDCNEIS